MAGDQIADDVLNVLAGGHCDGNVYYLPPGQLDRKLYTAVNKVLDRLGGKWDRKQRGHVFAGEAGPLLDHALTTGDMPGAAVKNPTAFYPTPADVVDEMLWSTDMPRIPAGARRILEPSAGKGAIARAVRDYCDSRGIRAVVECCEILPEFQAVLTGDGFDVVAGDFLTYLPDQPYDAVVMNPPFSVPGDHLAYCMHIEHAWSMVAPGGVLLAVAWAGLEYVQHRRVQRIRDLAAGHGGWIRLDEDAFRESGTDAGTVLLGLNKPASVHVSEPTPAPPLVAVQAPATLRPEPAAYESLTLF